MSLDNVVSCKIHPSIGVARVGNSPDEFFTGPEVPGPTPVPANGFKDAAGRVKRQAARFRIYGYDAQGRVVQELTAADVEVTWTVHLANKKAAWYQFFNPLDIPEASATNTRRNATVSDRQSLIIDPGPRSIHGAGQGGAQHRFTGGTCFGVEVPLGEIRTDEEGNLVVLGGLGTAGTPQANNPVTHFANNDGWYDDIADGPVTAQVRLRDDTNRTLTAEPAWVLVGPPNYGPSITPLVTFYDLIYDVAVRAGWLRRPTKPSFTKHIFPILERICSFQWVNQGFLRENGWNSSNDFLKPQTLARLASDSQQDRPFRENVFKSFRDPKARRQNPTGVPPIWGDGVDFPSSGTPRLFFVVTETQFAFLKQWAAGNFTDVGQTTPAQPLALREHPLAEQPEVLDRAALDGCTGGPFHPGIEATWPLRQRSLYSAPFRIRHKQAPNDPPDDFGPALTPAIALWANGPLSASGPGDLTRWMAVPWQTDDASCGAPLNDPLPAWWPARVPDHVISERLYRRIMDANLPAADRLRFFTHREEWLRHLQMRPYEARINDMIQKWSRIGVLEPRPGPRDPNAPPLPAELLVELESDFPENDLDIVDLDDAEAELGASPPGLVSAEVPLPRHPQMW